MGDDDAAEEDRLRHLSSFREIVRIAVPACLLNVAAPATLALQTALLGRRGGSAAQAAFAAVGTTVNTSCVLFNFLVDGVAAKVGQAIGARAWRPAGVRLRLAVTCGFISGGVAASTLAMLQQPVFAFMHLSPEVRAQAAPYYWVRVAQVPLVTLNMAVSGILQGFGRVPAVATITTAQSILEASGSLAVLTLLPADRAWRLAAVGLVSLSASLLSLIAGSLWIALKALPEAAPEMWHAALYSPLPIRADEDPDPLTTPFLEEELDEATQREAAGPNPPRRFSAESEEGHLLDFLTDGLNMLIRTAVLQSTFFLAATAASRLGTSALAAHAVVSQLWLLTSYFVDGFAVAGTVLGSRLVGAMPSTAAARSFGRLTRRLLTIGASTGVLASCLIWLLRDSLISLFTQDPDAVHILRGTLWGVLSAVQPINSLVFVFDGLLYSTQSFRFVRNVMLSGFVIVFLPLVAASQYSLRALWCIWAAKAAHNSWRLGGGIIWMFQQRTRSKTDGST